MDKNLISLLDTIIEDHPQLNNESHRIYLASMARGIRLMIRHGAGPRHDVPAHTAPGFDEWLAGNSLFGNAANMVRAVVGNGEVEITRRIRELEESAVAV